MSFSITALSPLASLLFGALILMFPKSLNYLIAIYLIVIGLLGLGIIR
jgi:drug/metabolite transporter (DMT)-like permease